MLSVRTCCSNNPPLVVFVTGIFAFALTTFLLAVSFSVADQVKNPDTFDWNTFFYKISALDFCVDVKKDATASESTEENEEQLDRKKRGLVSMRTSDFGAYNTSFPNKTVSLNVPISRSFILDFHASLSESDVAETLDTDKSVLTKGSILLDHLDRGRLGKYKGMSVALTLRLPGQKEASTIGEQHEICVQVEGPAVLLDDLNLGGGPGNCTIQEVGNPSKKMVSFVTHTKDNLPAGFCEDGTVMELTYELQPQWIVYLTDTDKELVSIHLMCMSAFLVALGAVIAVVTAFKAGNGNKSALARTLESDGRGDMQMVSQNDF